MGQWQSTDAAKEQLRETTRMHAALSNEIGRQVLQCNGSLAIYDQRAYTVLEEQSEDFLDKVESASINVGLASEVSNLFAKCKNLTAVDLRSWRSSPNEASSQILSHLYNLEALVLNCENLHLLGGSCAERVRELAIISQRSSGEPFILPDDFSSCEQLEKLRLEAPGRNCTLNASHLPALRSLPRHLTIMELSGFPELEVLPKEVAAAGQLRELSLLFMKKLTSIDGALGECKNLRSLVIKECDELLQMPREVPETLETLVINGIGKQMSGLDKLVLPTNLGATKLKRIDLSRCWALHTLPEELPFNTLEDLILNSCASLQAIPNNIGRCKNLRFLELQSCARVRELPPSVGALTNIVSLSVRESGIPRNLWEVHGKTLNLAETSERERIGHFSRGRKTKAARRK